MRLHNDAFTFNTISSSSKGKRHDLQERIETRNVVEVKVIAETGTDRVDRVFGTGITSYQIPTSIRVIILHYTAVSM